MTLRPFRRDASVEALRNETFDVVVVGGGITGAGVALDAASRGLRTALVERDDFAAGTSSKSSKLVHGGLRYLQQGEVGLVYQALAERQRLLRNAPHLVKVLPFLIPVFSKDGLIPKKLARMLGSAMWAYDLTGGARLGKLHERITTEAALAHLPVLHADRLAGAYLYYDAAADDARLTLAIARTAALHHGAVCANGAGAVGISRGVDGRADGVEVEVDGERITVRARAVVNAAGVWADEVRALDEGTNPGSIRPAKGIHITVPWEKVRNDIAAVIPVAKDRRSVFVVPWGRFTYVGTTDTDYDGPIDDPQCTDDDVDYLLGALNAVSTERLSRADVVGTWAGLRPLVRDAGSERTADLSRRHKVQRSPSGVVTITGGKLTTYREMAADTVDEVVEHVLGDRAPAGAERSRTKRLRLRGAEGLDTLPASLAAYPKVPEGALDHLAGRYGGEARAVMALVQDRPELAEPLVPGLPYLRAEATFAARHEMARTLDDVLSRRTRARLLARDDAAAHAEEVAALVGPELGWDEAHGADEVARYRSSTTHEREAAHLPETALDALLGA